MRTPYTPHNSADAYNRPPAQVVAANGILAVVAVTLIAGAIAVTVAFWPFGAILGVAALVGGLVIGSYVAADVFALWDGRIYDHHRRRNANLVQNRQANGEYLSNDKVEVLEPLPAPILIRNAALDVADAMGLHPLQGPAAALPAGEAAAEGVDPGLVALDQLFRAIQESGGRLSWPALKKQGLSRSVWDWALKTDAGLLPEWGVVQGRQNGAEGQLSFPLEEAHQLSRYMWELSTNGCSYTVGVNEKK